MSSKRWGRGNFFAEEHTIYNFKKHLYFPNLLNRYGYDKWKEAGGATFDQRANQKVRDILENKPIAELPKDVIAKVKEIVMTRDLESKSQIKEA